MPDFPRNECGRQSFVATRFRALGASFLGAPLAALVDFVGYVRGGLYTRRWLVSAPPPTACRVVSVGGLEAGGTGKTPACALLFQLFLASGFRPGLATRGYGRLARGLRVRKMGEPPSVCALGDEAAMMVASGLNIPVAAASRRSRAVQALAALGCNVVVLDDGFAHRAQRRDVDIVVLRGEAPFGNGRLLPRGSLRERPSALNRATLVWLHYRSFEARRAPLAPELVPFFETRRLVVSHMADLGAFCANGVYQNLAGRPVAAFAGTARPHELAASLHRIGAQVVFFEALYDHAALSPAALSSFVAKARLRGAIALVVTAKDAIKLRALEGGLPVYTWRIATRLESGHTALNLALGISKSAPTSQVSSVSPN